MSVDQTHTVVFHADLSALMSGAEHWLCMFGRHHPMRPHTAETRAALRAEDRSFEDVPDAELTHFAEVHEIPKQIAVRVHVKQFYKGAHARIATYAALYYHHADRNKVNWRINAFTTVTTLLFSHPDVMIKDPDLIDKAMTALLDDTDIYDQINDLAEYINGNPAKINDGSEPIEMKGAWATLQYMDVPAQQGYSTVDKQGNPVTVDTPAYSGYFLNPNTEFRRQAGGAQTALLKQVKNDSAFGRKKKWTITPGLPSVNAAAQSALQAASGPAAVSGARASEVPSFALSETQRKNGVQFSMTSNDSTADSLKVSISADDQYLRYLGFFIRFLDAEGNPIDLAGWEPDNLGDTTKAIQSVLSKLGLTSTTDCFFGHTSGATVTAGIPHDYSTIECDLTFPDGAASAEIYGAGLGLAGSPKYPFETCIFGAALSVLMDLCVPAFMLAGMAAQMSNAETKKEVEDLLGTGWDDAIEALGETLKEAIREFQNSHTIDWSLLWQVGEVLFNPACYELLTTIVAEMAIEEVAEEIPFAGWALFALDMSLGIANLTESIVELSTSPWQIPVSLSATVTTDVLVEADPRKGTYPYPEDPGVLTVTMAYKSDSRPTLTWSQHIPADYDYGDDGPLTASFPGNTLGGQIKIDARYTIEGWTAAAASTGWLENDDSVQAQITLALMQRPIPLDKDSVYTQINNLVYTDGAYQFAPCPPGTVPALPDWDNSNEGHGLSDLFSLSLSQRYNTLGSSWKGVGMGITDDSNPPQTGQMCAFQTVCTPGAGTRNGFPSNGSSRPMRVICDPFPPKFKIVDGKWVLNDAVNPPAPMPADDDTPLGDFYVDPPRNEGGLYHLRKLGLGDDPVSITASSGNSWGCFRSEPESLTMHPSGHVIAINSGTCKLSIVELIEDDTGVVDGIAPVATDYAGQAAIEDRPGLLFPPVAVTCGYDGTVYVLEKVATSNTAARIQAFDLYGNPVDRFLDGGGNPSPFLSLSASESRQYLDVSAVGDNTMTYLYVLYLEGSSDSADSYKLAIYPVAAQQKQEDPLVVSSKVVSARIFVDMWHVLYTLNYGMVTDGAGQQAGPDGRTAPEIGAWMPPLPTTTD